MTDKPIRAYCLADENGLAIGFCAHSVKGVWTDAIRLLCDPTLSRTQNITSLKRDGFHVVRVTITRRWRNA